MFCKNCGKEVYDNAIICPHCGFQLKSIEQANRVVAPQENNNTIALVGFIMSFLVTIAGLICSIIGFNRAKNLGLPRKNLALAGIIISIVNMVIGVILVYMRMPYLLDMLGTF